MEQQAQTACKADKEVVQNPRVHYFNARKRGFRRQSAGFSLIEILVVVSIIALLLSIGTAVALRATAEARRSQTRSMMQGLLSANDEYKAVRQGQAISHNANGSLSSTENFVAACLQIKTCEEIMISALNSSTSGSFERIYKDAGGSSAYNSIYDRWGTEIEYRSSNDGTGVGPANENSNTVDNSDLPVSRDPFFASAGPDQEWGTDDDITTLQR